MKVTSHFSYRSSILLMKCLDYFTNGPVFPELEVFVVGVLSVVGMGSLELNCGT
jgi:hypothetical protein